MHALKLLSLNKKTLSSFLLLSMIVFQSCSGSKNISFKNSSVVPAAVGSVKISKDKNNNYDIDLKLMHLAEPKRLSPPAEVYVVWMETDQNEIKNLGQIKSDDSFLSSTLKSALHTKTTFKPREIFITAEDKADVDHPGRLVVLRTNSF